MIIANLAPFQNPEISKFQGIPILTYDFRHRIPTLQTQHLQRLLPVLYPKHTFIFGESNAPPFRGRNLSDLQMNSLITSRLSVSIRREDPKADASPLTRAIGSSCGKRDNRERREREREVYRRLITGNDVICTDFIGRSSTLR